MIRMNLKINLAFIVIVISLIFESRGEELMTQNVTKYDGSFFQKVLSRRKRFLVWRPGSNVLVSTKIFFLLFILIVTVQMSHRA